VFARVKPEQKLRLVNAFRESGQVVAMTGDGVNDAPALKAAHIGIAMGLRGAEVAREVASLVLLRDDFAPIVSAIRLGRRIYANLVQAISYTVAVHIPMIAAAMIPVFVGWPPLLAPVHIVFLELIINPVCSVVFENEPERENLMSLPPRRVGARLLSNRALGKGAMAGAVAAMLVLGLYAGLLSHGYDLTFARTLSFMALVACNVALIFVIRLLPQSGTHARARQQNRYLWVVLGVAGAGLLLLMTVPALARLFGLVALLSA
jgi:Ca2+-transporting ATPase